MSDQTETLRTRLLDMAIKWRENRCGHEGEPDDSLDPYCCPQCVTDATEHLLPLLMDAAVLAAQGSTPQPVLVDSTGLLKRAAQYAALVRYEPSPALTLIMELRAALAATMVGSKPPALSWQPIASAPKDGTELLLALSTGVDIGNWQEEKPDGTECGLVVDPGLPEGWYGYLGLCPWDVVQPTHWTALPSPPVGEPTTTKEDALTRSAGLDVDRPPQHAPTNEKASSDD